MGGLISFLGGTAFRWIFGSILDAWSKQADHQRELETMRLQLEQDGQRHQWQQEAIAAQAAAGVKVIEAQAESAAAGAADAAFLAAVKGVNTAEERTDWIGAWNASIRPALASAGILLLVGQAIAPAHVTLTALTSELICAALGVFVGERIRVRGA